GDPGEPRRAVRPVLLSERRRQRNLASGSRRRGLPLRLHQHARRSASRRRPVSPASHGGALVRPAAEAPGARPSPLVTIRPSYSRHAEAVYTAIAGDYAVRDESTWESPPPTALALADLCRTS